MDRVKTRTRATVFDSKAEHELYRELDSRWNPKLRLMAQTPLRNLIKINKKDRPCLKDRHWQYFLKASVDFTFVYPDGRTLLSIEFDGIGGGYGRGRRYVQRQATQDPNRAWKLNFKLAAAERAGYPLFVISFEETETIDSAESIAIVDGIVGQFLSRHEETRLAEEMIEEDSDLIASLSPEEANEYVQDLVLQAGVLADFEHDPLTIAIAQEERYCQEHFGIGSRFSFHPWLHDPPLPDTGGFPPSIEVLEARLEGMQAADRVGARVGISTGPNRCIYETVWVRNIGEKHGLVPGIIADQLAHLFALRRVRRMAERGELVDTARATTPRRPARSGL